MSITDDFISQVFVWHALTDACEKCRHLNGQEFHNQSIYQDRLFHPIWGDVWDLNIDQSLTHPNCRCQLEVRTIIDWEKFRELNEFEQALFMSTGYTLGDIRQLREELDALKKQIEELKPQLQKGGENLETFRKLEQVALRYLLIARRLGLPEDVSAAINLLSRAIVLMRQAQITATALATAAGPIGWAFAIGGIALTGISAWDLAYDVSRTGR